LWVGNGSKVARTGPGLRLAARTGPGLRGHRVVRLNCRKGVKGQRTFYGRFTTVLRLFRWVSRHVLNDKYGHPSVGYSTCNVFFSTASDSELKVATWRELADVDSREAGVDFAPKSM
jgi:hypothetical protein